MGTRPKRYPTEFRCNALQRMQQCESVRALAKELGVSPGTLYAWRREAAQRKNPGLDPLVTNSSLAEAEARMILLEREAAFHTLQNGHFKNARLRDVELPNKERPQAKSLRRTRKD
jgi:transposase-like protein